MVPPDPPYEPGQFTYNELRTDKVTLIVITCNNCGGARVVSHFDGSLERWERDHQCESKNTAA